MSALFLKVAITLCQLFTLWILGGQLNMVTIQQCKMVNGFIVRSKDNAEVKTTNKDSQVLSISDFIEKLPGYSAQNLTLDGMIYFLIVIAAFIIGIFIFVMTLQKTAMFGVLKVQGVPTSFLARQSCYKPLYWLF